MANVELFFQQVERVGEDALVQQRTGISGNNYLLLLRWGRGREASSFQSFDLLVENIQHLTVFQ